MFVEVIDSMDLEDNKCVLELAERLGLWDCLVWYFLFVFVTI